MLKRIYSYPFHPLLFALYIVLAVAATDPSLIFFVEGGRVVLTLLLASSLTLGLVYVITKNIARAGYLTTLLLFLIFIFGHLRRALLPYTLGGISIVDERWFFPLWTLLIAALASSWVWRRIQQPEMITRVLNLVAAAAVVVPVFTITRLWIQIQADPLIDWEPDSQRIPVLASEHQPDIYYIILDGYGRQDVLSDLYGYDNQPFLSDLEEVGFYIASQSHSNYMRTSMSVASALNFTYLSELEIAGHDTANWFPLREMIVNSNIRQILEGQGYTFITFATGFHYTDIWDSDVYLSPHRFHINSFEQLIVGISALEIASRAGLLDVPVFSYRDHRLRNLYIFDQLASLRQDDQPKFVFAHITIPHPPFVFDASGNPVEPPRGYSMADGTEFEGSTKEYLLGYRDQLIYTNQRILQTIQDILARSSEPPVIIVQGDHGPGAYMDWKSLENTCLFERLSILNAYYLPGVPDPGQYPAITPVNTFRVLLNAYFGAELPLLEDRSFASPGNQPYHFQDITNASQQVCIGVISPP